MNKQPTRSKPGALPRLFKVRFIGVLLPTLLLLLGIQSALAGSATWQTNPSSGDWNTATNWMPNTIPNGPTDTATFAFSNRHGLSLSANTEVDSIVFNAGASAFTITAKPHFTLTMSGVGITNSSGITQNFVTAVDRAGNRGTIAFTNSATAGSGTFFTNNASNNQTPPGLTEFFDTSTAGDGTFFNRGGAELGGGGGNMTFSDASSAVVAPSLMTAAQS